MKTFINLFEYKGNKTKIGYFVCSIWILRVDEGDKKKLILNTSHKNGMVYYVLETLIEKFHSKKRVDMHKKKKTT